MARCRGKTCRILTMLTMTVAFFLVEIIVGYVTNSVAMVADSFHMLSDVVALIIGLASIRISKWPSRQNTFGWVRAEILGALVNSVFLLALCFSILTESLKRLFVLEEITRPYMLLGVGVGGLMVNVLGLLLFHSHSHGHSHEVTPDSEKRTEEMEVGEKKAFPHGRPSITIEYEFDTTAKAKIHSSHQLNMRGMFLHVLGDAMGSVVVIISSLAIWLAEGQWRFYLDPAMSFMLVILILASTIPLLKESSLILLQTAPPFVDKDKLQHKLSQVDGVMGVHEFHVWQLTGSRVVLSAHILCNNLHHYMRVAAILKDLFHKEGVHSTTIQPEFVEVSDRDQEMGECKLPCAKECQSDTCCGPWKMDTAKNNHHQQHHVRIAPHPPTHTGVEDPDVLSESATLGIPRRSPSSQSSGVMTENVDHSPQAEPGLKGSGQEPCGCNSLTECGH